MVLVPLPCANFGVIGQVASRFLQKGELAEMSSLSVIRTGTARCERNQERIKAKVGRTSSLKSKIRLLTLIVTRAILRPTFLYLTTLYLIIEGHYQPIRDKGGVAML